MQKISISGPAELLAVLPFHLGFRPARSVVLVCFHGKRMGLVARLDVCADAAEAEEVADHLRPPLRAESPGRVLLVGYEDVVGESTPLADALEQVLDAEGIELTGRFVVRGERWYGERCTGDCCPPEGLPLPADADVPGVAGYVAIGRAVLPGRESLTALIEPAAALSAVGDDRLEPPAWRSVQSLSESIREFVDEVEWARRLLAEPAGRSFYPPGTAPVDDSEISRLMDECLDAWSRLLDDTEGVPIRSADLPALVGCLRDVHIRDGLIAWLCPGTLGPEDLEPGLVDALVAHLGPLDLPDRPGSHLPFAGRGDRAREPEDIRSRLEQLCRLVPADHAAPLLSVVASYAWWCGDGVRAGIALERALELEPEHRLCALLAQMIALGIRTDRASA